MNPFIILFIIIVVAVIWAAIRILKEYGSDICIRSSGRSGLGGGEEIEKIHEEIAGLLPNWSRKTEGEE